MEIYRDTKWNRLFHLKQIKANYDLKEKLKSLVDFAPDFLEEIGEVTYKPEDYTSAKVTGADSLLKLLELHKEAWSTGFQNEYLAPDKKTFRTKSIDTMTPDEVFFGGDLWGLDTHNITFWEGFKEEGKRNGGFSIYRYLTVYQIVLQRYKEILTGNIKLIKAQADRKIAELKEMGY